MTENSAISKEIKSLPLHVLNLLSAIKGLIVHVNEGNLQLEVISSCISQILKNLPEFYQDTQLKFEIIRYLELFRYITKIKDKSYERSFAMHFCKCIFTDGLTSFFTGFDGFYGEDISKKIYLHDSINKLNIFKKLIEKSFPELLPYDNLTNYLNVKYISEVFVSQKRKIEDRHHEQYNSCKRSCNGKSKEISLPVSVIPPVYNLKISIPP